ncbi:MAG: hypothetical protein CMP11_03505 [Zetaproteobacteria bacterium]|nr:hypothetical protein [Pseudobdellovibrionaceae bacterium]|tara:strand:- start:79 stop:1203 length:1125 start_codon:yes stop_codon:yes gene_type:complete
MKKIILAIILNFLVIPSHKEIYSKVLIGEKTSKLILSQLNEVTSDSGVFLRQEDKTVVKNELIHKIFSPYRKEEKSTACLIQNIQFLPRDTCPAGAKNVTFTFYGKSVGLGVAGLDSSIKLRARFYLQVDPRLARKNISRAEGVEDSLFLELKLKNPSVTELGISKKYRIKIKDADLLSLYSLKPKSQSFSKDVKDLLEKVKSYQDKSQYKMTHLIFDQIRLIAKSDENFIKPYLAISYHRSAYKYIEKDYPLKKKFYFLTTKKKDIEYQLTIDENIKGYSPKPKHFKNGFLDYFNDLKDKDLIYQYPQNVSVVEFKQPILVAKKSKDEMSTTHLFIKSKIIDKLFREAKTARGFLLGKGKLHQIRKHKNEEKS